nr:immunoglobulin heavy chain junction region [Mus musculus]MBK4185457.1 immunoglobulin heavy chain junction region [Mus musculus]MBK4185458.1 immunoglobulin heavy chain junction region [Mus musculus]MBK4185463.1 immunoglobulin heavy chain junction region [Mus musculus]MBK4185464.1 immunoglobulin heavy chain junction region [Mus musculus]
CARDDYDWYFDVW